MSTLDLPRGSERVLVVEDQDALRESLCTVLARLGYHVFQAKNPYHAEAIAIEAQVDVLLMDVILPSVCGITLAEQIARHRPNVKILYMSGYTTEEVMQDHGEHPPGMDFLQKPFDVRTLATRLRELLDSNRSATTVTV
ncbi:MAG: response regulator [Gemmatimonadetes bacterium]|nr:MAG: response regulator [Gemmatimonadota bacterium]